MGREELQSAMYGFIKKFFAKQGRVPTLQEIADGLGFSSRAYMLDILNDLEEMGLIRKSGKTYIVVGAKITFDDYG